MKSLSTLQKQALLCVGLVTLNAICSAQDPAKNANPGSLWSSSARDDLRDRVARRKGDLITILISESSSSSFSASTNAKKNDATNVLKATGPLIGGLIPNLSIGADSSVTGSGNTTQSGRLTARMTAIVKEVLPNGTLLIEGTRAITTNKETQLFSLSGIIRVEDVRSDNTVLSESLADAQIKADGRGMISDRQRKGLLTRLLDWLF